ncbi:LysR family transcriptional regulator [Nocardioides sp. LMS-CY]|uniref:LysR substrate-binding domain-containing protein n=1 Tax=Nocardioides sp. (strain LMS-CY) TaxID=2840457 RepID=UPI001C002307|nr:LysR substrate-binding domain-containing protein [Nocardioides sp. LMS-CY]QWF20965.1 LysR family transcriptional regulator [Nocardioides sp. LMS-CY]
MELRHLRYYVAVAEECHFGRAAERLHIAQPPLSQQIKQLESELGVQLLTRSTRRVELTPAGERYLQRAREILAGVDDAADEAVRVAAGEIGRVTIGFTGSATYELLPTLSRVLRAELPGVRLDLRGELLTPGQVAGLLDGSLDVGLLRPPVGDADVEVRHLRDEPLVAVLPESHPLAAAEAVAISDLRDEPFVGYPSQHRSVVHDAVAAACRGAGFAPRPTEVAETSTLVSFVAAGLGVALVPASVRHLRITGATYRPLAGRAPTVALALATRRGDPSPVVARVVDAVRAALDQDA